MKRLLFVACLLLFTAVLAACGANSAPVPTPIPPVNESVPPPAEVGEPAVVESGGEAYPGPDTAVAPPVVPDLAQGYPTAEMEGDEEEVTATAVAGVRSFTLVPEQSEARYIVAETFLSRSPQQLGIPEGLADTIGRTQSVEGSLTIDFDQTPPLLVSNQFQVDISTLTSDQRMRDNRIRSGWLESATYPLATFVGESLADFPEEWQADEPVTFTLLGQITIRNVSQPVSWTVTATLVEDTIQGTAVTELTMTDFGFDPPVVAALFSVEDVFLVEVDFTATE